MSVLGQSLPVPATNFGQRSEFYPYQTPSGMQNYTPGSHYSPAVAGLSSTNLDYGPYQAQPSNIPQRGPLLSPRQEGPGNVIRGVSPRSQIRTRTPIAHYQQTTPSRRSSRPEELYAYAAVQNVAQQPTQLPNTYQGGYITTSNSLPSAPPLRPSNHLPSNFQVLPTQYDTSPMQFQQPQLQLYAQQNRQYPTAFARGQRMLDQDPSMSQMPQINAMPIRSGQHTVSLSPNISASPSPSLTQTMSAPDTYNIAPEQRQLATNEHIRILTPRPKPQCWEHGCNGRQFSTFSNLLRHQREKNGSANKSVCPHCGTEFTRTTARNGHLTGGKCKLFKAHTGGLSGGEGSSGDDGESISEAGV